MLLTPRTHELAAHLERFLQRYRLTHGQIGTAGRHRQARRGLEALWNAQVGRLGPPQLAGLACKLGLTLGPVAVNLGQLEANRLATLVFHPAIELNDNADNVSLPVQSLSVLMAGRDRDDDPRTLSMTLTYSAFEVTIKGIATEEFPTIPMIAGRAALVTFALEVLCSAVGQVAFIASSDDTRPLLTGMRLTLAGPVASFAAADTFRIAFRSITLETPVAAPAEVVVPVRAMLTLGKLLGDVDGTVELLVNENYVIFRADEVELVARCIDGAYPAIDRYLNLASSSVVSWAPKNWRGQSSWRRSSPPPRPTPCGCS